jgi:hypothetical protein
VNDHDDINYHSDRARKELDLGLTARGSAASSAHMRLASLHMQRVRELSAPSMMQAPLLRM